MNHEAPAKNSGARIVLSPSIEEEFTVMRQEGATAEKLGAVQITGVLAHTPATLDFWSSRSPSEEIRNADDLKGVQIHMHAADAEAIRDAIAFLEATLIAVTTIRRQSIPN